MFSPKHSLSGLFQASNRCRMSIFIHNSLTSIPDVLDNTRTERKNYTSRDSVHLVLWIPREFNMNHHFHCKNSFEKSENDSVSTNVNNWSGLNPVCLTLSISIGSFSANHAQNSLHNIPRYIWRENSCNKESTHQPSLNYNKLKYLNTGV